MRQVDTESNIAAWVHETHITPDTGLLSARANERALAYLSEAAAASRRYAGQSLDPVSTRKLHLLTRALRGLGAQRGCKCRRAGCQRERTETTDGGRSNCRKHRETSPFLWRQSLSIR